MMAIYFRLKCDKEVNDKELNILVENANSSGGDYRIFSEITDQKQIQPLKENLLARIHNKEFNTIMLFRLSDWSASMTRMSHELAELSANGIRIISHSENIDSFTPTGKLYLQMLNVFSEFKQTPGSEVAGNESDNQCLNREQFKKDQTIERKNDAIPDSFTKDGKALSSTSRESFDLVGLNEACQLTGYSRNTIFQMTSKKQIPFYKRPGGRRIFFSKRALEQWIMTGKI
jgi:excisionase family DNA binding protein